MDRKAGTLGRSLVAGARETEVMISYLISEGTVLCFQATISLFVVVAIFGIHVKGSIIWAALICLLIGLSGISMGNLNDNFSICQAYSFSFDNSFTLTLYFIHFSLCIGFLSATICSEAIEAVLLSLGFFLPNVILAGKFLVKNMHWENFYNFPYFSC